jgi:hypothetical protein
VIRNGDNLKFSFIKPLNSQDVFDINFVENECVYVLWAYGGTVSSFVSPATLLSGHTRKGVFRNQTCINNDTTNNGSGIVGMSITVLLMGTLAAILGI